MKIGDKFFTIAYSRNTRVIEVEVIDIEIINDITYIHFQNTNETFDKWFKPIDYVNKWKFGTKDEAERELLKYD